MNSVRTSIKFQKKNKDKKLELNNTITDIKIHYSESIGE